MPLSAGDPKTIGDYELRDRLGSGGMGVVYLARSASGRQVAVKVVHAQFAEDEEFRTRFRQEVAAARRVSGAFTAPVVDADADAERPWMATLYVPGPTLSERLTDGGPLDAAELRQLALGLTEALGDIHRAGVVHRDLKPANVLMADDGPRVIDFGISRAGDNQALTVTGRVMGTPPFMSPEQLSRPREVTGASDVFSLGALLVYAAIGRSPFDAESPYMTAYQVVHEPPALEEVAQPLHGIVERCLAKDPEARPGLTELGRLFAGLPGSGEVRAAGGGGTKRKRAWRGERTWSTTLSGIHRRRPVLATVAVVGGLALGGGTLALVASHSSGVRTTGSAATGGEPTVSVRAIALPDGWRPWQISLVTAAGPFPTPSDGPITGDDVAGRCAQGGTKLYCGGNGFPTVRVDGVTGHVDWHTPDLSAGDENGMLTSGPTGMRDGRVLVHDSPTDAVTRLVALDADSGRKTWSREVSDGADAVLFGHAVLESDRGDRSLTAWKTTTGEKLWTVPVPKGQLCTAEAYGEVPYAECTDADESGPARTTLLRLDPRHGTPTRLTRLKNTENPLGVDSRDLLMLPATDAYGAEPYPYVIRVDTRTGAQRKVKLPRNAQGTATLIDGRLYFVQESGRVTAVDARSGRQLWSRPTTVERLGAPQVSAPENTVYLCSASGRLLALNLRTGEELWQTAARSGSSGSGGGVESTQVLRVRGALVALASDGTLFSADPLHPDAKPVISGPPTRSGPPVKSSTPGRR
ncbi:protein kinase [Streptomyces sp. NPDC005336]|uniref:serine/threonine-protein kinase n=1 Tax=Streptomyces sp. NPDC005336 TaxID=3157035 RepID=UPI0033B33FA0